MITKWRLSCAKVTSDNYATKSKWDKSITEIYDTLIKLSSGNLFGEDMEFECLKVIFVETRNEKPDISLIQDWIYHYLDVNLTEGLVAGLVNYVRLMRPEFVLSEADALDDIAKRRPLRVSVASGIAGRDKWCYDASKLMLTDRKNRFIRRRKLSTEFIRRLHSGSWNPFGGNGHDMDKKPPRRIQQLLGVFEKSKSAGGMKVTPIEVTRHRRSVGGASPSSSLHDMDVVRTEVATEVEQAAPTLLSIHSYDRYVEN